MWIHRQWHFLLRLISGQKQLKYHNRLHQYVIQLDRFRRKVQLLGQMLGLHLNLQKVQVLLLRILEKLCLPFQQSLEETEIVHETATVKT